MRGFSPRCGRFCEKDKKEVVIYGLSLFFGRFIENDS
jgi:hypothetical protein